MTEPARPDAPEQPARGRRPLSLQLTLTLGFAGLAILPVLVAIILMTRIAEQAIVSSTTDLAGLSQDTMAQTSVEIARLSKQQLAGTGAQLTQVGSQAVRDASEAMIAESERHFRDAHRQLIHQGEAANSELGIELVGQSRGAIHALGNALIHVSEESNRELSNQTARQAARDLVAVTDELVSQAQTDISAISDHLVAQDRAAAQQLSERMLADIEREPVVKLKTLAMIFANSLASAKLPGIRDGYLTVVDARGKVIASNRHRRGASLKDLSIVQMALASQSPAEELIHFKDGGRDYLGVFARRADGAAVVFAYLEDRARVDTERMQQDVRTTLDQMGSASSQYVVDRLDGERRVLRSRASELSLAAIARGEATSRELSRRTAERMQAQAALIAEREAEEMSSRSTATRAQATAAMTARSRQIADAALAGMRPLGQHFAAQAEKAMHVRADGAVREMNEVLRRTADKASRAGTARMRPQARVLASQAVRQIWLIAGCMLVVVAALGWLFSRMLSRVIASPIVSEQAQAREEIIHRTAELQKAQELHRLKTDFVNAVSHELRTPLTSIMGYSEFLEDCLGGPLTPTQSEFVRQIQGGATRLQHLVDDLLDFARLEAGTFRLSFREADLVQRVETVVNSLQPLALAKGCSLTISPMPEGLPLRLDPERIGQVLTNLLTNAIKFTPTGGAITVGLAADAHEVRITVKDTGIGIHPDNVHNLFEKFYQVDPSLTRENNGAGLGLSIAKALVVSHGGRIGVESRLREGSAFWFTLPRVTGQAPEDLELAGQA